MNANSIMHTTSFNYIIFLMAAMAKIRTKHFYRHDAPRSLLKINEREQYLAY